MKDLKGEVLVKSQGQGSGGYYVRSINNKMAKLKTLKHFPKNRFFTLGQLTGERTEEGETGVRTETVKKPLEAVHACQSQ